MKTIVLTGGGTAGHCIPNVALLPYLKDFNNIIYIGSKNGIEKDIIAKQKIEYHSIDTVKLERGKILKNISIPFKLFRGINQAKGILKQVNPSIVFSKGGFVSVPVVIACKQLNIPVVSHESDLSIGLANKINAKLSKKLLTSFPETACKVKNGAYVGPPLKNELFNINKLECAKFFGFDGKKPILLITGGSQGAKYINSCIRIALPELLKKYDVLHLCGKNNLCKTNYKGYKQIEYLGEMEKALSACSVCVSRAGSNTIFELLALKKPTLLIPLPKGASRGDQILNANYFYNKGLVNILLQEQISKQSIINKVNETYANKDIYINNLRKFPIQNSCKKISEIISLYAK
ncbi:MAG: undecaprenyldiphospho-muramoylpentapeptide beta-N-acetylglucosaminyltransferase [Clostridia bacterium]|nr:undecaprenyldiphospho-muramoylpentapeptide beta-N-acetylglucosaminyltransferase [Clostridia bacterium]